MAYEIDKESFQRAIEDLREIHKPYDEALSKGWKPNFQKAIDAWHTACMEFGVGKGYVGHVLEAHPETSIMQNIQPDLVAQAKEFLAELEENSREIQTAGKSGTARMIAIVDPGTERPLHSIEEIPVDADPDEIFTACMKELGYDGEGQMSYIFIQPQFGAIIKAADVPGGNDSICYALSNYRYGLCKMIEEDASTEQQAKEAKAQAKVTSTCPFCQSQVTLYLAGERYQYSYEGKCPSCNQYCRFWCPDSKDCNQYCKFWNPDIEYCKRYCRFQSQ